MLSHRRRAAGQGNRAAEKPKAKTITGTFAIEFVGMDGEKTPGRN